MILRGNPNWDQTCLKNKYAIWSVEVVFVKGIKRANFKKWLTTTWCNHVCQRSYETHSENLYTMFPNDGWEWVKDCWSLISSGHAF